MLLEDMVCTIRRAHFADELQVGSSVSIFVSLLSPSCPLGPPAGVVEAIAQGSAAKAPPPAVGQAGRGAARGVRGLMHYRGFHAARRGEARFGRRIRLFR